MGNCAGSPKTKEDNDVLPIPEPAKDDLAPMTDEEAKLQLEEKMEDGHDDRQNNGGDNFVVDDNDASSLGSLPDEEKKKEAKENERGIEVPLESTKEEEKPKTAEKEEEEEEEEEAKEKEKTKTDNELKVEGEAAMKAFEAPVDHAKANEAKKPTEEKIVVDN